jgi:peptidoglycan/LPS O-acetylase OafA/YrhL
MVALGAAGAWERVNSIDAVRGFAALLIAYYHSRQIAWIGLRDSWDLHGSNPGLDGFVGYLTAPVLFGGLGVPVFFVVSGYVIHGRQAVTGRQDDSFDVGRFYLRRFVRIYPVLVFTLLVTWALDMATLQYVQTDRIADLSLTAFVVTLLGMNEIIHPQFGSNGALWSLAIEIQLYAAYPIGLMIWRRLGPDLAVLVVLMISVVSWLALERNGLRFFTSYWASWWIGAWIADCHARGRIPALTPPFPRL